MNSREAKRKLLDTSIEEQERSESAVFQKSKLVARSPTRAKGGNSEMEEILRAIQEMRSEMNERFDRSNEQNEKVKKEVENINQELVIMKVEMKKREEEWKAEKEELYDRIQRMEEKAERQEKEKRRNNIIIRNANIRGEELVKQVEDFMQGRLKIQSKIVEAYEIGDGAILAKVKNWKEKKDVMKNSRHLKGTEIYIENDMTLQERKIQKKLRQMARDEKEKGNEAKVGYRKLTINNKVYLWEEIERGNVAKN